MDDSLEAIFYNRFLGWCVNNGVKPTKKRYKLWREITIKNLKAQIARKSYLQDK